MRYVFVLLVCLSFLTACNKPVSCLTDADCADGSYCRSTQCIEPSAEGDLNEVFEERIRPIVETGCGCHGPDSGRPWSYFATDDKDTEKIEASHHHGERGPTIPSRRSMGPRKVSRVQQS